MHSIPELLAIRDADNFLHPPRDKEGNPLPPPGFTISEMMPHIDITPDDADVIRHNYRILAKETGASEAEIEADLVALGY